MDGLAYRRGWEVRSRWPGGGALIEQIFRDEWGRVLAALIGFSGFDLAEEAVQDAFTVASSAGRVRGHLPTGAWLVAPAQPRDDAWSRGTLAAKSKLLESGCSRLGGRRRDGGADFRDERLELIFTCCHPALSLEARWR